MSPTIPNFSEAPHSTLLHQARVALQRGEVDFSQTLSKSALLHAKRLADTGGQARALLCLSLGDQQMSRLRRARDTVERVAHLYQLEPDALGEAEALTTLSHVLSATGHSGKGTEAALLAIKLCEALDLQGEALAYSYLGVSYAYGQSFDKAAAAFQQSIQLLESEGLWREAQLSRFHWRAAELYRCFLDRYCHGTFVTLARLEAIHDLPEPSMLSSQQAYTLLCPYNTTLALLELTNGFESCWRGDWISAGRCADRVCASTDKGTDQPIVRLMEVWLRAEIAWGQQDWQIAEAHAQRLQLLSLRAENEHLRGIAYLLQAQICAAQGKDTEAQNQLRLMKAHEAQLRNENLNSCDDLLNRQLRAATVGKAVRLSRAPSNPGLFVHEDSLTGLSNRRYLEQVVPGILAKGVERNTMPAMVFVDVNAFQQINDRLSRSVGDAVLKALAQILGQFVGEGDVLARLGGDEFVLVLAQVDAPKPRVLMARIRGAVAQHAWSRLHADLAVEVSCVLTLADPYDTLDSWLNRCELSMYIEKDARYQKLT